MSRESINALLERWMEDEQFRGAVRTDPEGAIRGLGLELTAEEWTSVRAVDWHLSDEELTTRITKVPVAMFCLPK